MRSLRLENQRRGSGTACAICTEQLVCVHLYSGKLDDSVEAEDARLLQFMAWKD